jgi:DNA (cytosine-5)-methyltransferase 1
MECRDAFRVSWKRKIALEKGHGTELHVFGRVRSVTACKTMTEVVDITVADDHSFIADGQVVHNCTWGPLDDEGRPIKSEKGRTFRAFVAALSRGLPDGHPDEQEIFETLGADFPIARLRAGLGYRVEWRVLRACEFGAPTIRKRLYVFARRDGLRIVWPKPTHGDPNTEGVRKGRLQPWRTAAECIDWSIPCPPIFEHKRPLKDATLRRIARGIMKFVVNSPEPFVVKFSENSTGGRSRSHRIR